MKAKNLRLNVLKGFIASTPKGKERLNILYEPFIEQIKRERQQRKELNYTPASYER